MDEQCRFLYVELLFGKDIAQLICFADMDVKKTILLNLEIHLFGKTRWADAILAFVRELYISGGGPKRVNRVTRPVIKLLNRKPRGELTFSYEYGPPKFIVVSKLIPTKPADVRLSGLRRRRARVVSGDFCD